MYGPGLPEVRLVAIADAYEPFAVETARRFGYAAGGDSWQAVAEASDVDVGQRRGGQLAAPRGGRGPAGGRQARAVREAARADRRGRRGHGGRRGRRRTGCRDRPDLPPVAGHQRGPRAGARRRARPGQPLQRALLVRLRLRPGRADELALPRRPGHRRARRHRQPPGRPRRVLLRADRAASAAPCSPPRSRTGRCRWASAVGHAGGVAVGDTREPVENEDVATFTATFAGGAVGTFSVSRIAYGHANTLRLRAVLRARGGRVRPGPAGRVQHRRRHARRGR